MHRLEAAEHRGMTQTVENDGLQNTYLVKEHHLAPESLGYCISVADIMLVGGICACK